MGSGAVDAAVLAVLKADATLTGLAPGGVFRDVAPQGVSEPFVVVTQMAHEDMYEFGGVAWESFLYLVKAVQRSTDGAAVQSAADRVHALLQDATITPTGYLRAMLVQREERTAYVEVDDESDARFQHRGGLYRVLVEPS